MYRMSLRLAAACAALALIGCASALLAQDEERVVLAELSSPYILTGIGDYWGLEEGDDVRYINGSFAIVTQNGDPETIGDDDRVIMYGVWKIKVGDQVRVIGDTATGSWSKVPVAYVLPPPGLGLGRTGGFIDGEWTATISEGVTVTAGIRIRIVRDQARFEVTIRNSSATPQSVGCAVEGYLVNANSLTIGYPFIPGRGINRVGMYPERAAGMLMSGSSIPSFFEVYDDMEKPATVVRATLEGQDCVKPDYLAIADHYQDFYDFSTWLPDDYTPDPMRPIDDFAYLACWNPKALAPSATRKIVTYAGVGAATARWTNVVSQKVEADYGVLAVQGPRTLSYDSTGPAANNDLSPQPFTVRAYVYNLNTDPGPYSMQNVTASIYLPPGLELAAEPDNAATKTIGPVPVNSEAPPVTWKLKATGQYCGELEYSVSAWDPTGWQQTVARKVMVPATRRSVFTFGWQLMHVPFGFNNPQIDRALGLRWGTFGARYWDPVESAVTNAYLPLTQLEPGKAFWMFVGGMSWGETQPLQLASDAVIVGESVGKQVIDQYVRLQKGWNMVGNPFVYPVYWGQVLVYSEVANITVSLDQAVAYDWLSRTIFEFNPHTYAYDALKDNSALLNPWKGYWVRAKQPVTLIFRPPVYPAGDVTARIGGG